MGFRRWWFLGLYAASGAAALVYEVTWTRLFSLQLGHTVAAASTVLAAFMGGLAVGAWIAGAAERRGLYWYSGLEIGIAIWALALPFALRAAVPSLAWAYADGSGPLGFGLTRLVISLVLLGAPAAAMGATFPIAVGWFARTPADAGLLYAANTAGAAAGALSAGFWLIPALGLRGTTWIGVALNAVAAAGAVWLATTAEPDREPIPPRDARRRPARDPALRPRPRQLRSPGFAWTAVAVSGFAALVYEVAWTRLLAMIIGPTTYAFATMASAFVTGLAIGSAIGSRLARRSTHLAMWLAAMLLASSVGSCAAASYAALRLPLITAAQVADPSVVFARIVIVQALSVTLLLLPMTIALGATFPLALALAAPSGDAISRDSARVYAANTTGAIAGALAGGFVLIPWLGLRLTVEAAAVATSLTALMFLAVQRRTVPVMMSLVPLAVILALPAWDHALLASGAYKYAPYLNGTELDTVLRAGTLDYYKEGAAGTVSVRRLTGIRSLAIDGKVDASDGGDMLTQRLLGLLPVLIHGSARDICVIGLGSGVTAASALAPGTASHEDVIEISPEVVEASHFFDRENERVLSNPAVRLVVADGRSHLLLSRRSYDVIISEPSNPWMAGVATLFTREFFETARARLNAGGLLCQWAHTYDISRRDLQSIVRTFASVFPNGTIWLVGGGDVLLIGARDGDVVSRLGGIDAGCGKGRTASMLASLGAATGTAAFDVLSLYAGGPHELAVFGGDAPIQDDDRTLLEYSAPRAIYGRSDADNAQAIHRLNPSLPPAVRQAVGAARDEAWTALGTMLLRTDAYPAAYGAFERALGFNSRDIAALRGLSDAAAGSRQPAQARDWLRAVAAREPDNAPVRLELSRLLAAGGDFQGATTVAEAALRLTPDDPRAAEQLASVLADAGDGKRLMEFAEAFARRFPDRPDADYYRATALFLGGQTNDALRAVRHVVDSHPDHARAQNLLGAACATVGQSDCARAAFDASIRANPRDPSAYVNAGLFRSRTGNPAGAVEYFAEALTIDPQLPTARAGLAEARAALGTNPR